MTEITYSWNGGYQIPDIGLTPVKAEPLGKYGRMRRAFLKEHRPVLYDSLTLTEELFPHLYEVQRNASARVGLIMEELLKKNPPPDKMADQMGWVCHMNSLKAQAEEVVLDELIYN